MPIPFKPGAAGIYNATPLALADGDAAAIALGPTGKLLSGDTEYATKVTVSGTVTYVGVAAIGSAQASAVWQAKKIDQTTGTVITWADGNANFDNVATDLTALTYS